MIITIALILVFAFLRGVHLTNKPNRVIIPPNTKEPRK